MAERASASQVVSYGIESLANPGVAVAAPNLLAGIGLDLSPVVETNEVRPQGAKYPSAVILGKESSQLGIGGNPCYEDLAPFLASALCAPTTVTNVDTYTPKLTAADTVATMTIYKGEQGAGKAEQVLGAVATELGFSFSRDAVEVSGGMIGKAIVYAATATASPVARGQAPMLPADVCVFWDPTSAALGTTKLLRVLSASWSIGGRQNPLFVLDCAQTSYVAMVEGTPSVQATLQLEVDAAGVAFVTTHLRPGAKGFLRIECNQKAPGTRKFKLDTACMVNNVGQLGDQDGVYAYEISLTGIADTTWGTGKVTEAVVDDGLAVLVQPAMAGEQQSAKSSKKAA